MKKWHLYFVFFLLLFPAPICTCLMIEVSVEEMWENSDVAVKGIVKEIKSYPAPNGLIYRVVEIAVEAYYLQVLNQSTVKVRVEGGTIGDRGVWVEDQPEFKVGEKVFVFLKESPTILGDYQYKVYAAFQGKFSGSGPVSDREPLHELIPEGQFILLSTEMRSRQFLGRELQVRLKAKNTGYEETSHVFNVIAYGIDDNNRDVRVERIVNTGILESNESFDEIIRLNFTVLGNYYVEIDGEINRINIYELITADGPPLVFHEIIVEPDQPTFSNPVTVRVTVENPYEKARNLFFRILVSQPGNSTHSGPILVSREYNGYTHYPNKIRTFNYTISDPSVGLYNVTVFYREEVVLEGQFTVLEVEPHIVTESEKDQPANQSGSDIIDLETDDTTFSRDSLNQIVYFFLILGFVAFIIYKKI